MKQKAPDELVRCQCHNLLLAFIPVISPPERYLSILYAEYAVVGDGDPVGVLPQDIGERNGRF